MLRSLMIGVLLVSVVTISHPATAHEALVIKKSTHDVKTTMERLQAAVRKKGLKIFALIDHTAAAKAVGLKLRPTEVLIFGSPKLGTLLMQNTPTFALDLPLKILVWQGADGTSRLAYTPPENLAARHAMTGMDKIISKMTKVMDVLSTQAAQ